MGGKHAAQKMGEIARFGVRYMEKEKEDVTEGNWSSGMIPVLGTGGPGFNSRIAPFLITCHKINNNLPNQ